MSPAVTAPWLVTVLATLPDHLLCKARTEKACASKEKWWKRNGERAVTNSSEDDSGEHSFLYECPLKLLYLLGPF